MNVKELRCPEDPRRLFAKFIQTREKIVVTNDNLIEFACQNCKRNLRDDGEFVNRVLHRYNLLGDLVETHVE